MTTVSPAWSRPPRAPRIEAGEVHVWSLRLDFSAADLRTLASLLSADEMARAARFHFAVHRDLFTARRGLLRTVLARYLGADPAELEFREGEWGKPALADGGSGDDLRFNASDSEDRALIAVACDREVGVDVERIRADRMDRDIPERFFSPNEVAELRALPGEQQVEAFFNCWTRKEAYIKAKSMGLHLALDSFDVSLAPGAPAALLATRPDPSEVSRWSMKALTPGPSYAGALVVEGSLGRLCCFDGSSG